MSKGANKEITKDPDAFLQDNVIMISEGVMAVPAGDYLMNLKQVDTDEVVDAHGIRLGVFVPFLAERVTDNPDEVVLGASKSVFSHKFRAFFLPWQPDKHFVLDLDDSASYLFTPGLTGCTFAAIGGAAPQVGHFNYLRPGTDKVSKTRTRQAVTNVFGAGRPDAYLKKSMYATPTGVAQRYAFIVGWRRGAGWRFVAQFLDYVGASTTTKGRRFLRAAPPQPIHNGSAI
jgi:hypothetical protein